MRYLEREHWRTFVHWHVHRFRPQARWGLDGQCRCGMLKRRMFGGWGYAFEGPGWWWDSPRAATQAHEEGD